MAEEGGKETAEGEKQKERKKKKETKRKGKKRVIIEKLFETL